MSFSMTPTFGAGRLSSLCKLRKQHSDDAKQVDWKMAVMSKIGIRIWDAILLSSICKQSEVVQVPTQPSKQSEDVSTITPGIPCRSLVLMNGHHVPSCAWLVWN